MSGHRLWSPEAVTPNINNELLKLRSVAVVIFRDLRVSRFVNSPALSYIGRVS
jgi:hypothetical protein